jgi:hypothetical protein
MKSIKADSEDSLRPEYQRSDFRDVVQGKYASTQVDFHQFAGALLVCIGEDEGLKFMYHSTGNYLAQRKPGDWTYEIDNANQITLRYWLGEFDNIEEPITNSPVVANPEDRTELHEALLKGVRDLRAKVAARQDQ